MILDKKLDLKFHFFLVTFGVYFLSESIISSVQVNLKPNVQECFNSRKGLERNEVNSFKT